MKKTKLLMPILGIPALFATTLPAIVSCHDSGDVDGPEEFIMPELEAQETTGALGGENIMVDAYQYIMIPNIKWKNPKHVFYGINARAEVTSDIDIMLHTEIIPHIETSTFDVMVYFTNEYFGIKSGTKIDFNLSIWARSQDAEAIKISEDMAYSMILKTAIIYDSKMSYSQIQEATTFFNGIQWFWLANFDHQILELQGKPAVSGFDTEKFGTVNCVSELSTLSGGYGIGGRLSYTSEKYATEFEGDDFATKLVISHEDNATTEITVNGAAVSYIMVKNTGSTIDITKTGDNVYEGDSADGAIVWTNSEEGKTAGDLTWNVESHWYQDWFKSIEATANEDGTVHFKLFTNKELEAGFWQDIPLTTSYKNSEMDTKYPLMVTFDIPKP